MPDYVTVAEAADILGVSRSTIDKMIDDGRIPVVRLSPRVIRVERSELEPDAIRARIEGNTP